MNINMAIDMKKNAIGVVSRVLDKAGGRRTKSVHESGAMKSFKGIS